MHIINQLFFLEHREIRSIIYMRISFRKLWDLFKLSKPPLRSFAVFVTFFCRFELTSEPKEKSCNEVFRISDMTIIVWESAFSPSQKRSPKFSLSNSKRRDGRPSHKLSLTFIYIIICVRDAPSFQMVRPLFPSQVASTSPISWIESNFYPEAPLVQAVWL